MGVTTPRATCPSSLRCCGGCRRRPWALSKSANRRCDPVPVTSNCSWYDLPATARWLLDGVDELPLDDLGDEVFAELGRVTWAAVHLEDFTTTMCAFIRPTDPRTDRRILGQKIKDAQQVLDTWPTTPARDNTKVWLERARNAIDKRNASLHAAPLTWFAPDGRPRHALGDTPRGDRSYAERPMTVESLGELRQELTEPLRDWRPVLLAASAEAKRLRNS